MVMFPTLSRFGGCAAQGGGEADDSDSGEGDQDFPHFIPPEMKANAQDEVMFPPRRLAPLRLRDKRTTGRLRRCQKTNLARRVRRASTERSY